MSLRDIVNVVISREISMVTRMGFGIPLFLVDAPVEPTTTPGPTTTVPPSTLAPATFPPGPARVTSYSSPAAVKEDWDMSSAAYQMAEAAFSQIVCPRRIKIGLREPDETYGEALMACSEFDDDFYAVAIESKDEGDILDVAATTEGLIKIFGAASADPDIRTALVSDDVMSQLASMSYARTFLVHHTQPEIYHPECAWLGRMLPYDPGEATWKFKTLNSVPVDRFTPNERDVIRAKGANWYQQIAGVNMMREGVMAESATTFIDIIRGIDWLRQRMMERIFACLTTQPKVPYTNSGIATIESLVRAQLEQGIARGVIAPEPAYEVTVPDALECDPLDRANRYLRDVTFKARLAGAIHEVYITGVVTA